MIKYLRQNTCHAGKSLSESLLFAEHFVYKNCSECQKQFPQHVFPRFELGIFMY